METKAETIQFYSDRFYMEHGPCCAGCDWWDAGSPVAGQCLRTAPVSGAERVHMLGISSSSLAPKAGHIMTLREHHCGEFKDEFDWLSLPRDYLRRIGFVANRPNLPGNLNVEPT